MMKDRKGYILEKAFDVFMNKGYDSASITVLQKELGMSRGALYRYFKSKDELFIAVVDKYVVGLINHFRPQVAEDMTLIELIEYLHKFQKRIFTYFDKINFESRFLNFTALMIQAAKYYPGFIDKMKAVKTDSFKMWKRAILNSVAKNEIRKDVEVDILAGIFSAGSTNPEIAENEISKKFLHHAKNWKRDMEYLYSLIKA